MNYTDALAYLYGLSDFERGSKFRNDREQHLLRESRLLELLGNPHQAYTCTLIAGTKGKGSTAACIESVLRAAGVCTGLYTQPDLHTFRERMRVRGRLISEAEVVQLLPQVRAVVEQIEQERIFNPFISYEVTTALALLYFQRQNVQHAVLEVGIGGRLDATNVTQPLVSVISSISFDHMNVLGHTLEQIATEKAGIIKPSGVVVTSVQSSEALLAIAHIAQERQARLIRIGPAEVDPAQEEVDVGRLPALSYRYQPQTQNPEGQTFTVFAPQSIYRNLELSLAGLHQSENATLALAALETLRASGKVECNWQTAALRRGLREVRWSARLEIIARQPTIIVDGAHNTDSLQKLLQSLRDLFTFQHLLIVLGVNADKDLVGMIQSLADINSVILTSAYNPRSAAPEHLQALFVEHAPQVKIYTAIESSAAMDLARRLAKPNDLICATGSLYLAAEVLRWAAAQGETRIAASIEGVDH
jgi:dihydrofolate synthase / folylpolyglutamate synthase